MKKKTVKQAEKIDRVTHFMNRVEALEKSYQKTLNLTVLGAGLSSLASEFRDCFGVGALLVHRAEMHIERGQYELGIAVMQAAEGMKDADEVTLFLRLAEYSMENGEESRAIAYLTRLCTQTVENYEDAIENRGLTEVWLKYRPLVEENVPKSVHFNTPPMPLAPDQCTKRIDEIVELSDDALFAALSEHLGELSAEGDALERLNECELIAYDADLLMTEVNSGGFGHYLYYHGDRLGELENALGLLGAEKCISLLGRVKGKFPRATPPKVLDTMQSRLDKMEEKGIDFEDEDDYYYESAESELIERLCAFVRANRAVFR